MRGRGRVAELSTELIKIFLKDYVRRFLASFSVTFNSGILTSNFSAFLFAACWWMCPLWLLQQTVGQCTTSPIWGLLCIGWTLKPGKGQHVVHTCQSLKGAHTFDVLAQAVTGIHTEFQLQDKVIRTTTDNVSNFVKAFQQFNTEAAVLPAATAEEDLDGDDISIDNNGNEDVATQQLTFIGLDNNLNNTEVDPAWVLPPQMRCVVHTMKCSVV